MPDASACSLTRRFFLRTCGVGLLLLGAGALGPAVAKAQPLPDVRLRLYNPHTGERLSATYRDASGLLDYDALDEINHLLRCHHTGEVASIDVRVLDYVGLVQTALGGHREIHVVSGYRSPEYNALLVRSGKRAARRSLHVEGQAVDIVIPGVHPRLVRDAALRLRYGGVGYYPRAQFVHLDSGPYRFWQGRRPSPRRSTITR